ncbi:MAG: geranylgeranylglyceryl/heptaprenylglyceryl phosphate synthase [Candidatus Thermoplasmatota archaeon]|nr:geranylgeranylglyceryl/heptaprenylglyceryl phosphate synthase [Candidatus Thermoplasmatota archaeon]
MTITDDLLKKVSQKKLHFSLLDPEDQTPDEAGRLAKIAEDAGTSAMMVGGSTLVSSEQVDETVKAIKANSKLPVILFPSGAKFLSKHADAIFFMSLLNSRNLGYVIREHVQGAPFIKHVGIEPIPMGYLIVEPGMTAGKVGEVDIVKRDDVQTAVGYGLATEYLGMKFFYLEAGSGAPDPVSNEMIVAVKKTVAIPLVVGGGIRDAKTAKEKAVAGADIIVTGTTFEKDKNVESTLREIIKAIEE